MQISPTEGEMVFEVKINPADIGQLITGLFVSIKLDAFDYSIYGSLDGRLLYLSSARSLSRALMVRQLVTIARKFDLMRSVPKRILI